MDQLQPPLKRSNALEHRFMEHLTREVWIERVKTGTDADINALFDRAASEPEAIKDVQVLPVMLDTNLGIRLLAKYRECIGQARRE